ncbi:MAG: 2-C-methyl-D-erythritol 4-phosphate cytidylyltransferase [Candidatus Omnitrophica bacterium]|nr:2-C-methyl-D-erythritol 4-phosphate cytidylyltransferase [Candidatus Omnitrophota bacterium]
MKSEAIVASAGIGKRLRAKIRKPYLNLLGKPILVHTLQALSNSKDIDNIIVVVNRLDKKRCERIIERYRIKKVKAVVVGGRYRYSSVRNGLNSLDKDTDIVIIHDAVRPFIDDDIIGRSVRCAKRFGACVVGAPVISTIKEVDGTLKILSTPKRKRFWFAQTPQVFRKALILRAYNVKGNGRFTLTDDAACVERLGVKVRMIMGSYRNIKITTPEDLAVARGLAKCA